MFDVLINTLDFFIHVSLIGFWFGYCSKTSKIDELVFLLKQTSFVDKQDMKSISVFQSFISQRKEREDVVFNCLKCVLLTVAMGRTIPFLC